MQDEDNIPAADETPETETVEAPMAEAHAEEAEASGEAEEPSEVANTIARMGLTRMSSRN